MKQRYRQNKKFFLLFCGLILVIALIFPFFPSKYKPHNAMVDIMSYPMAVISVIGAFAAVVILTYYQRIYRLKKDLDDPYKIILKSYVMKSNVSKFKGYVHYFIWVKGVPFSLARHMVSYDEYKLYQPGTNVEMHYTKHSKLFLSIRKI